MIFNLNKKAAGPHVPFILISQEVFEDDAPPYAAAQDLSEFVKAVRDKALYEPHEYPNVANLIYHADQYIGQVNNAGHSQFVFNDRARDESRMEAAHKGLLLIGATEFAKCTELLMEWCKKHPILKKRENGFSKRSKYLDELDQKMAALDVDVYHTAVREFLNDYGKTRTIPHTQMADALAVLRDKNPLYDSRKQCRMIENLDRDLIENPITMFRSAAAGVRQGSEKTKL